MGDELVGSRLERRSGQGATEIGFVEPNQPQPGGLNIVTQPAERAFVLDRQQNQGVRRVVPASCDVGMGEREINRGVNHLAGLRPGWKVSPDDHIEARALEVRHGNDSTGCPPDAPPLCRYGTVPGETTHLVGWPVMAAMVSKSRS